MVALPERKIAEKHCLIKTAYKSNIVSFHYRRWEAQWKLYPLYFESKLFFMKKQLEELVRFYFLHWSVTIQDIFKCCIFSLIFYCYQKNFSIKNIFCLQFSHFTLLLVVVVVVICFLHFFFTSFVLSEMLVYFKFSSSSLPVFQLYTNNSNLF